MVHKLQRLPWRTLKEFPLPLLKILCYYRTPDYVFLKDLFAYKWFFEQIRL